MDLNFAADGDLRELSAEEAWETIENFAQGQKEWDKTFKAITEHELASLRAQANELFRNKKVWCEMPRCIAWDNVDNLSPQVLLSFEVYTSPATYPKEVEETIGVPMEVKPLDQMKLEDVGFDTFSHDIPLSSREVPSLDESKPQPQHLPSFPSLDAKFKWQALDRMSRPSKQTKMIYTRITKLIIDHFLSTNKSIPRQSNAGHA
ncbi:hypothetical protein Tco_0786383 [Tanacetum coccineum]